MEQEVETKRDVMHIEMLDREFESSRTIKSCRNAVAVPIFNLRRIRVNF